MQVVFQTGMATFYEFAIHMYIQHDVIPCIRYKLLHAVTIIIYCYYVAVWH